jgi:hypothetical protein
MRQIVNEKPECERRTSEVTTRHEASAPIRARRPRAFAGRSRRSSVARDSGLDRANLGPLLRMNVCSQPGVPCCLRNLPNLRTLAGNEARMLQKANRLRKCDRDAINELGRSDRGFSAAKRLSDEISAVAESRTGARRRTREELGTSGYKRSRNVIENKASCKNVMRFPTVNRRPCQRVLALASSLATTQVKAGMQFGIGIDKANRQAEILAGTGFRINARWLFNGANSPTAKNFHESSLRPGGERCDSYWCSLS